MFSMNLINNVNGKASNFFASFVCSVVLNSNSSMINSLVANIFDRSERDDREEREDT